MHCDSLLVFYCVIVCYCRLISETSLKMLLITMTASLLHLLFEFLAFQSDVNFWKDNKSLAGLSTRAVVTGFVSQLIVFLYLVDGDTSLLVTIPAFIALVIQAWKVSVKHVTFVTGCMELR
jgi:hypothetical protein